MRVLLDTHVLLWWFNDQRQLSNQARRIVENQKNDVFVSAVSAREIAIKSQAGKLDEEGLLDQMDSVLREEGFKVLEIKLGHAIRAGRLALHHRDPFDRMLVAQSLAEDLPILSTDKKLDTYGVRRVW